MTEDNSSRSNTEYDVLQKELLNQMMSDYSEIFDGPPVSGFDCPPGWEQLVRSTFAKMVDHIKEHPEAKTIVAQVKEKYGALRIYIRHKTGDETINNLLNEIGHQSYKICDWCGKPGALRHGSWIRTLCEEHAQGRWPFHEYFEGKGDTELYEWTRRF